MEHVSSTDNADSWLLYKELHIVHLNIHYVLPKLNEIQIVLSQNPNIECLCMCETVLDNSVLDSHLFVPGYLVVRKDRASLGGGLVLYIKDNLCCYRRTDIESENIESRWLEFKFCQCYYVILTNHHHLK